jgi:hypothetical protein
MRFLIAALVDRPIDIGCGASSDSGAEDAKRGSWAESHWRVQKVRVSTLIAGNFNSEVQE